MEKNSFENLLRNKVLQAELTTNQNFNKENVWRSIHKKRQPQRKWYYAAAAIMFIIGVGSVFYVKKDNPIIMATKTKTEKPAVDYLPKASIVESAKAKQDVAPIKAIGPEHIVIVKQTKSTASINKTLNQKEEFSIAILPVADEVAAVLPKNSITENKTTSITSLPEFTLQFKRGASITNNIDENIIITTLKKFKLKRDTTYYANAVEKQPTKIKLTFKKEN